MAGGTQRGNEIISGINVTPLVDIVLVLLIIFIVTAKVIDTPAVPLDLPRATTSEQTQTVFSLVVPAEGEMLVNGQPISGDRALARLAKEALLQFPDLRAVIQADGAVPHRRVLRLLDTLKRLGISKVAFGALPEEEGSSF